MSPSCSSLSQSKRQAELLPPLRDLPANLNELPRKLTTRERARKQAGMSRLEVVKSGFRVSMIVCYRTCIAYGFMALLGSMEDVHAQKPLVLRYPKDSESIFSLLGPGSHPHHRHQSLSLSAPPPSRAQASTLQEEPSRLVKPLRGH